MRNYLLLVNYSALSVIIWKISIQVNYFPFSMYSLSEFISWDTLSLYFPICISNLLWEWFGLSIRYTHILIAKVNCVMTWNLRERTEIKNEKEKDKEFVWEIVWWLGIWECSRVRCFSWVDQLLLSPIFLACNFFSILEHPTSSDACIILLPIAIS